jgi:hypothetical protein
MGRRYDRIVVHFQPGLYVSSQVRFSGGFTAASLLWLCLRRRQTQVLVHEAGDLRLPGPGEALLGMAFRVAPTLLFHTRLEQQTLERRYGIRVRGRVVQHVDGVRLHGTASRNEARRRLSLPEGELVMVAPGFLHPGKGLEQAVEAFRRAGRGRLYLIGSVRDPVPENVSYAERLRELANATPGVELVERFVDDETFDAWIAAADAVVLPYRRSWSSGVLARAQAIGTPAIVSAVGGLPEQASPADVVVRGDEELAAAIAAVTPRAVAT